RCDSDRDELAVADAQHLVLRVEDRTVERLERLDGSARGLPQLPQVRPVARLVEVLEVRTLLGDLVRQEAVRVRSTGPQTRGDEHRAGDLLAAGTRLLRV